MDITRYVDLRFEKRYPHIRRLLRLSWHEWLCSFPNTEMAIQEVLFRVPEEVFNRILYGGRKLCILPQGHSIASSASIPVTVTGGVNLLLLAADIEKRHRNEITAIISHEMAHIFLNGGSQTNADSLASSWGFKDALLQALETDLEKNNSPEVMNRIRKLSEVL